MSKTVSTWNGSAFANPATTRFVYDGWNLLAELNSSGTAVRSYAWGQDLTGTTDGAGGVGGLLIVADGATGTNHFGAYDGNGNLVGLVAQNGSVSAHYEYGPFNEPIRVSGLMAKTNPFRASTKFTEEESGVELLRTSLLLGDSGKVDKS